MSLLALTVVVLLAPASALAGLRWCYTEHPDAIFCDDFDRYCIASAVPPDPNEACSGEGDGCTKHVGAGYAVWVPGTCGTTFNIDESCSPDWTGFVHSNPFSASLKYDYSWDIGQHTVRVIDHIQDTLGGQFDAVVGTDANPLILDFVINGQTYGKITHANAYIELSLWDHLMTGKDDQASVEYVKPFPVCSEYCAPNPGWAKRAIIVMCQQENPPPECPPIESAPHHAAVALGALAYLDTDPCHCDDPAMDRSTNEHLAFFDGYKWYSLRSGLFPGEGDFLLRDRNNPIRLTITSTKFKVEMTAEDPEPDEYSWCEIPRDYLGSFNTIRGGMGRGCMVDLGTWECANEPGGDRRYKCLKGVADYGRFIWDSVALSGGEGHTLPARKGACCLVPSGQCVDDVTEYVCETTLGGTFQGMDTTCAETTCCPVPFADADADGDVDQQDFGAFQHCYTGPGASQWIGPCTCFDRDYYGFGDGDVDVDDFTAFEACWSGPTVPANPACE